MYAEDPRTSALRMHQESIYNLIPPKPVVQERPPMYKSKHSADLPPTASTFPTGGTTCPAVANIGGSLDQKLLDFNL
eukprot:g16303.t1